MTFLPIVGRELRVGARRASTYWLRFAAALCLLAIWLGLTLSSRKTAMPGLSKDLFVAFGVIALGFCLIAGIFLTADCLSEEKREGTLGLLFLTDLKGYDVVLGKLFGTSIQSLNALIAIFPMMGLPLLMGGVTRGEFWRVVLALLTTIFLSLSLGMLMSALNREARQAMSSTFLALLTLSGLLPATWWLATFLRIRWPAVLSLLPSPVHLFGSAFDSHYRTATGPGEFWTSFFIILSMAIICLVSAAVVLPKSWQEGKSLVDNPDAATASRVARWVGSRTIAFKTQIPKPAFLIGLSGLLFATVLALFVMFSDLFKGVERSMRWLPLLLFVGIGCFGIIIALRTSKAMLPQKGGKELLEQNPFLWLASRDNVSKTLAWVMVSVLSVAWGCFFVTTIARRNHQPFILCLLSAYAVHQVFKLMAVLEVTRHLGQARRNGCLELLLVTPLDEAKILDGQEQALNLQFRGVRRLVLAINLCLITGAILIPNALCMAGPRDTGIFLELFLGGILMLLLDFKAIASVGMLMALRYPKQNRAVLAAWFRVMGIPWAAVVLIVFMGIGGALNGMEPAPVFAVWFALGIVTDLLVGGSARAMLSRGIRACQEMKASPFNKRVSLAPPLGLGVPKTQNY